MIAKAAVISHGANAVRYATEKDKAEIIKLNLLPYDIPLESIWQRMVIHQKKFEAKLSRHRPLQNNAIRIEVSPARNEHASYVAYGNSMAVDPWGTVLCRAGAEEAILCADLELDRISAVRAQLPILNARRTDLYQLAER